MPIYKKRKKRNGKKVTTWTAKFNYRNWQGIIKQKKKEGFTTKREAIQFEREFIETAESNPDMSFKTLVNIYMNDCKTRLKPTTVSNKQYLINLKVLPYFENMPINTIEAATVREWQNELISSDENYSDTYLKTIHNQLSAIFNFAIKYYKLPANPARICGSMGKKNADKMQFWTKEEFNNFRDALSDKPLSYVVFSLFFWTGIRSGELLALTLNDFDFENRTLSISKNYARENCEDLILTPKTDKSKRIITLPRFLCNIVKEYAFTLYDYQPYERLFSITKHYLYHEMKRGCKNSGVKKIRVHDLRHSHASLLIEMNYSPLLISERLGHENIETTLQTYSHLYPNKHAEVADQLDALNDTLITNNTLENK